MIRFAILLLVACLLCPGRAEGQGIFAATFGTWVTADPAGACTNNQPMQYNTNNGNLWGCDAGTWTKVNSAAGVTGSGTLNTITKWTGATSIGNSSFLTENASTVIAKYGSANTNYATSVLALDNPSLASNAAETISFRANGIESGRISANQNGGMTISSDIQGTGAKPLVISTFDVGGFASNTITISTNVGSSGLAGLGNGWIAINASQGAAGLYLQTGRNISVGANGFANTSTDITGIDLWTAGTAAPGLRLRNGPPSGADTSANPFQIVNTTVNGPTVLASFGPLAQPASVGTTPGTNELSVFSLTGGGGGNTTVATTGVGGNAGSATWTFGAGGTANSVSGANNDTGGNGGGETHTMGNGANATATDTGTNTGGNGGFFKIVLGSPGTASNGSVNNAGKSGYFQVGPAVAFASLPSCAAGLEGAMAPVNNSSTIVFAATITGGGANHVLAYCDGTNWVVH